MATKVGERLKPTEFTLEERQIGVWRCAAVAKGGRRFSFAAMMVVGNGAGVVGVGYGKARDYPAALEKAVKDAKKNLVRVKLVGGTIPCEVRGRFGAAKMIMVPASPGTGIIAGRAVRAVCEAVGIRDVLTKSYGGSNNAKNLVRATLEALLSLRSREDIAALRGVDIEESAVLAKSRQEEEKLRFEAEARAEREEARRGTESRGGERRRGRGGRERNGRGGRGSAAAAPSGPAAAVEEKGREAEASPAVEEQQVSAGDALDKAPPAVKADEAKPTETASASGEAEKKNEKKN